MTCSYDVRAWLWSPACIGKWHLGFAPEFRPAAQGFDHYFGLLHNLDPVETVFFDKEGGVPLMRNGHVVKRPADPAELTRLYTEWKHFLSPALELFDLDADPGERQPIRNAQVARKLRGMAVMFQEEMSSGRIDD